MLYKLPQSYLTDPQQMNSYAYARNNPIIYTDPTGEFTAPSFVGFSIGTAINTVKSFVSAASFASQMQNPINFMSTMFSIAKTEMSYLSRSTPSSIASDVRSAASSGWGSLKAANNTTTFSQGYGAGMGPAGAIAGTAATAAFGGAAAGLARSGTAVAAETVGGGVLRGAANPVVADALAFGRAMHAGYKLDIADGVNFIKEFRFTNGLRADGVDKINKVIYELKPDNSRAMGQGYKQLESYRQQMFKETGEWYGTVLDTYTR